MDAEPLQLQCGNVGSSVRWRAAAVEHADQDEEGVVDPVESLVCGDVGTCRGKECNALFASLEIGIELVRDVFGGALTGLGFITTWILEPRAA